MLLGLRAKCPPDRLPPSPGLGTPHLCLSLAPPPTFRPMTFNFVSEENTLSTCLQRRKLMVTLYCRSIVMTPVTVFRLLSCCLHGSLRHSTIASINRVYAAQKSGQVESIEHVLVHIGLTCIPCTGSFFYGNSACSKCITGYLVVVHTSLSRQSFVIFCLLRYLFAAVVVIAFKNT